jgi:hypothetical protein
MDDSKCKKCGLVNFGFDSNCRRCGNVLGTMRPIRENGTKSGWSPSSLFYTLVALALIGSAVYYIFSGFERSYDQVRTTEATRAAQQPKDQPVQTRSQFQKQQTGTYGTAVKNSNGLMQSQQHVNDIEKLTR